MWVSKDMARVDCSGGPCPFAVRERGGKGGGEREGEICNSISSQVNCESQAAQLRSYFLTVCHGP